MTTIYAGYQFQAVIAMALSSLTGGGYNGDVLDGIQRASYDYSNSINTIKECGSRVVFAHLPDVITITGTFERAYTGSGILGYIRGADETGSLPSQESPDDLTVGPHLGFYPNGYVAGQPYIVFAKVTFAGHRFNVRPGSNLQTEIVDFFAKRMFTGSL